RQEYFHSDRYLSSMHSRTLIMARVPTNLRDDQALFEYVQELTPSFRVVSVSVGRQLGSLPKLVDRHTTMINKLERVLASYLQNEASLEKPRPAIKVKHQTVDAIEYYTEQLEELQSEIRAQRERISANSPLNYAFVAYASAYDAHMALKSIRKGGTGNARIQAALAPHPRDIIWENLTLPPAAKATRKTLMRIAIFLFCCAATVPTSLLSMVTTVPGITGLFPESKPWFDGNPQFASFWQTLISPLILAIYFMILPFFFRMLSRLQGITTKTAVERAVMKKMYLYWMFSQVIVFTLMGVLTQLVADVQSNKKTVAQLFENLVPNIVSSLNLTSSFWINYISLRWINNTLELVQLISLLIIFSRRYFTRPTPRQVRQLSKPPDFDYAVVYATYSFLFVLTLIFSVYAPLILIVGMVLFALGLLVFKYQLMYVYTTRVETAGLMWRAVVNRILFSTVLFQLYVLLAIRFKIQSYDALGYMNQWALAIPPPCITFIIAVAHRFWLEPRMALMQSAPANEKFQDMSHETKNVGDWFIRPLYKESETTPMVSQKVKHLLHRVYQGRRSMIEPKGGNAEGSIVPGTNLRYDFRDTESESMSMVGHEYSDSSMMHSFNGGEYEMNSFKGPNDSPPPRYPDQDSAYGGYYQGHPPGDFHEEPQHPFHDQPPAEMRQGPHNPYQPSMSGMYGGGDYHTGPPPGQPPSMRAHPQAHDSFGYGPEQVYDDYFDQTGSRQPSMMPPPPNDASQGRFPPHQPHNPNSQWRPY
ncbi:hypothetical protein H4R35_005674, partial [Dimargaris xerosporica]